MGNSCATNLLTAEPSMTKLSSQLTLALLTRNSEKNLISRGFTLVELMIVIVIVGILSSIALPSFLSQQNKAKLTEATTKMSAILKAAHAEYQFGGKSADAITSGSAAAAANNNSGRFIYTVTDVSGSEIEPDAVLAPAKILIVSANPARGVGQEPTPADFDEGLAESALIVTNNGNEKGKVYGCINLSSGKIDIDNMFKVTVDADVDGTGTTVTKSGIDCA